MGGVWVGVHEGGGRGKSTVSDPLRTTNFIESYIPDLKGLHVSVLVISPINIKTLKLAFWLIDNSNISEF